MHDYQHNHKVYYMATNNHSGFSSFSSRKVQEKRVLEIIIQRLQKNMEVLDISEKEEYFELDIDLIVKNQSGKKLWIEVKIDDRMWETGNFFFEIISNEQKCSPGCFIASKAHLWLYVDTKNTLAYILPLDEIRRVFFSLRNTYTTDIREIDHLFSLRSTHTQTNAGKYSHTTIGRKVKVDLFLNQITLHGVSYGIWNYMSDDLSFEAIEKILAR